MKKSLLSQALPFALCVLAATVSPAAFAEDSQEETPQEERDAAEKLEPMPERIKQFVDYIADLDKRYPDSAQVDPEKFLTEEGEAFAASYCKAAGFDGPCVVEIKDGVETFVPHTPAAQANKAALARWWSWLDPRLFAIGVIPERTYCPSQYPLTWFYHDDEDRRNANSRGGWIGGTTSNNNTAWRYCRVDSYKSLSYRPLPYAGNRYDYSVLNLGAFCPSGARRVMRFQENEIWNNQNSSSGLPSTMPSLSLRPFTLTWYCHFDGAASSWLGHMSSFPKLGFAHGVHAPSAFPKPWALANGWVHQDDEDWFNLNFWIGWPDDVMFGGGNTWRGLSKVE